MPDLLRCATASPWLLVVQEGLTAPSERSPAFFQGGSGPSGLFLPEQGWGQLSVISADGGEAPGAPGEWMWVWVGRGSSGGARPPHCPQPLLLGGWRAAQAVQLLSATRVHERDVPALTIPTSETANSMQWLHVWSGDSGTGVSVPGVTQPKTAITRDLAQLRWE